VDDAMAFYKSKAWTDLAPQREKAQKTKRGRLSGGLVLRLMLALYFRGLVAYGT
jgi:hypothetical protein